MRRLRGVHREKIVQKSGAWFSYGDQRLGQGRENVRQFLRDNPELVQQLRREVIAAVQPEWTEPGGASGDPGEAVSQTTGPSETAADSEEDAGEQAAD